MLNFKMHIGVIIAGIALTAISYLTGLYFQWTPDVNYLEAFAVFTSYWCTFLCVFQTRWNYPIGAVSVAALCLLFYQQSLFASMALQVYLFPTLLYGWFRWRPDADTRPVTTISIEWWPVYLAVTAMVGWVCMQANVYFGGENATWDTTILVLSILAQFMLDNKKLENWIVWFVVDVISVVVYWNQDLKILAVQMGLFGLNAVWGFYEWYKTYNKRPTISLKDVPLPVFD